MKKKIHKQAEENLLLIEFILRPITYTSWLLGVGVAHPRKCPKSVTIILRIIHLALCSISVTYNLKNFLNSYNDFNLESDIYKCLRFINLVISHVSTYYYIYQVIRQYDKWLELMDKIKELDQKIMKEMPISSRPIKIVETLAILATFTCCPLGLIADVLYYYFTNPYKIGIQLTVYYMSAQSLINSFVFDVVVYVLYCRLEVINKLAGQLDEISDAIRVTLKIRRIREMHNGIWDLVIMINDIHGFHLLLCSVNCLTMAVTQLFAIYTVIMEKNNPFMLIYIILPALYITQFGLMCWICTLMRREIDKSGIIIYTIVLNFKHVNLKLKGSSQSNLEMETSVEDSNSGQNSIWSTSHSPINFAMENLSENLNRDCIRREIKDFLIQLQHRRVVFTACGFFEMNNVVFSGFIGVIIVYLTICIQFYKPTKHIENTIRKEVHSICSFKICGF
ncbi:uncharacterized protein LOC118646954 [Monomorium pharaonis]|uniref:uncharacterized protein LOC118646954 n=1 Tax=Monomorium pharaonis TaxID=307658 RepID=UPI00174786BD|nr:uncharacterized protein LOC118646954 [Monomorium pharaonis]